MSALELETPRLTLRQWRESDFEAYALLCADPVVMKYLSKNPMSRLEAWKHLAFLVGHWQLKGFGHFAVEHKDSGQLIGRIGFLQPEGWPGFELGWTLAQQHWGKGYATEGANAALAYAAEQMGKTRADVISLIHPQNEPSKAVAKRLGAGFLRQQKVKGIGVEIWGWD